MEDSEIVELYFRRDEKALSETMSKYDRYLNAISARMLADAEDAKECINDTYAGAWSSIPPNRPANLATYLGKILRRKVIMKARESLAEKRVNKEVISSIEELESELSDGRDFVKELEAKELAACISGFLREQRAEERNVFIRRYYYFEDIRTIALEYGFTQSKVKMLLKRTRDRLWQRLRKEGYV